MVAQRKESRPTKLLSRIARNLLITKTAVLDHKVLLNNGRSLKLRRCWAKKKPKGPSRPHQYKEKCLKVDRAPLSFLESTGLIEKFVCYEAHSTRALSNIPMSPTIRFDKNPCPCSSLCSAASLFPSEWPLAHEQGNRDLFRGLG